MTKERKQVYTRRITEANRTQLITIVYELAMEYMDEAIESEKKSDLTAFADGLRHADACVDDLLKALDMKYDLSENLRELYLYVKQQLICASGKRDLESLKEARQIMENLHRAWKQIESKDSSPPEFKNKQTVYAGLTYGKGTLKESIEGDAYNRGIQA